MAYFRGESESYSVHADQAEESVLGKQLVARGPNRLRPGDAPDVEGTIVEERRGGRLLMVKEDAYDTPTAVNIHGGWIVFTIVAAAAVAIAIAAE